MSFQKRLYSRIALLLAAFAIAGLLLYHVTHYVFVDFHFYPKSAQTLDLREKTISPAHFDKLQRKLPNCRITWDVPLSSGSWPSDSEAITVTSLTEADVSAMAYFPKLQKVDAQECRDYGPLLELLQLYPSLLVRYTVFLGNAQFQPSAREIEVQDVPQAEFSRLACLPELESLVCAGGTDAAALMRYCHDAGIDFAIRLGDQILSEAAAAVQAENVTADQFLLFSLLPKLKELYLINPQATAQDLTALRQQLPGVKVDWELPLCGVPCSTRDQELDISEGGITLEEIREKIACFPDAKTLYLGAFTSDYEMLAQFREEMRSTIKVVWQVQLGKKLTARTDDTSFMPVREHVYYFNDEEAYNLRYCEDIVALDIGHMSIHNIDFVEFMPNLTYLILAHTQLQYIEPISTCKNLKFLELDWSPVRDLSPLVGCTSLEDLNLGQTFASFEPVKQMTWLKNLWVINCNQGVTYQMRQALPNTKVQGAGDATVASGWRNLPNYYAMRDELDMYYMSWG